MKENYNGKLNVFTEMSDGISIININPCINVKVIKSILMNSKSVIISAYGMGNIPTKNLTLMNLINEAI